MTEKRALEKSIEMWEKFKELNKEIPWLPVVTLKELYFEKILKNNPKYIVPLNGCYLCEFTGAGINCPKCPVKNWSKNRKYGQICTHCTDFDSVYRRIRTEDIIDSVLEVLKETYNNLYNN